MKPALDELAIGTMLERRRGYRFQPPVTKYTKFQIEMFVLNSQRLKIEAYKQARKALEKPFNV